MIIYMPVETLKRTPELLLLAFCLVAGLIFFAVTNPRDLPPVLLMFGFAIILGVLYSGLRLAGRALGVQDKLRPGQYKGLIFCGTVLPVLLLALQSLGQLTVRDVVTLILLFAIGFFYLSRISPKI